MNVFVILPAYNEAENLPDLIDRLEELRSRAADFDLSVIIVNDGSTDNTHLLLGQYSGPLNMQILTHETNKGLAKALETAFSHAAGIANQQDVIVSMDADNSHLPSQIPLMLEKLRQGCDIVIASRYRKNSVTKGVPFSRRVLSRVMSVLFRCIYPVKNVRDYSCGFRAYKAEIIKSALAQKDRRLFVEKGFACMVCILLQLVRNGALCGEIPMKLRYDRKKGDSKMKVAPTILRTLIVLLRQRFRLS